jgi:TRAP-type C4-dicarboxylate transport system permease small subunit
MDDRTSIWSVPAKWQKAFFWLFTFQMAVITGILIWYHGWQKTNDTKVETFIAIGHDVGGFILPVTALTFILVEVGFMLSEIFLRERFEKGREQEKKRRKEQASRLVDSGKLPAEVLELLFGDEAEQGNSS